MKHALFLLALVLGAAMPAMAATQILLTTGSADNDCAGKSATPGFFPVQTFTIGGIGALAPSGAGGVAKTAITSQGLTVAKVFNNCSAVLITQFLKESLLPTVQLLETESTGTGTTGSGAVSPILSITLSNAVLTNYSLNDGGGGLPAENLIFSFEKACITAYTLPTSGSTPTPTTVCYDAATGTVN